jgi:ketosteroid isomerase-like protein
MTLGVEAGASPGAAVPAEAAMQAAASLSAVARFDAAFTARDVDAVMAAMTEDCLFEATVPPDGTRYVGQRAVRAAWAELFAGDGWFETEERFACGDRVVVRWRYQWHGESGDGHVRGVDLFRVRDGLVAEKLAYVKG